MWDVMQHNIPEEWDYQFISCLQDTSQGCTAVVNANFICDIASCSFSNLNLIMNKKIYYMSSKYRLFFFTLMDGILFH
jgi:hypothetical protein